MHLREACSTGKEHQESGVRECSYLQRGTHPLLKVLSGLECTLQNPLRKVSRGCLRFLKPIAAYERRDELG